MATLRQLKTFLTVAEQKKMSLAARKLYISQPTVSQIISELEAEYNTVLFERLPKELKITEAGKLLYMNAQQILSIYEELDMTMKQVHSERRLRIGATLTVGDSVISELIVQLLAKHPDIEPFVCVEDTKQLEYRLLLNELDIALSEGLIEKDEIITRPAMTDTLVFICGHGHRFFDRETIRIEDLKNEKFILREVGSGTRAIFERLMAVHQVPIQKIWEANSNTAIIDAVSHNLGLGLISQRSVNISALKDRIRVCPIEDISLERYFYLCYNKKHLRTTQMQDFMDEVELFRDM